MNSEFKPNQVRQLAEDTGFNQNPLEKVLRLLGVLSKVSAHPGLKDCFVLKGGTGLNFFYYDVPRLSVDVDFNYVKSVDKNQMHNDRKDISNLFIHLFSSDYDVHISKDTYALLQFEFGYTTVSRSSDLLKIDINFLHRLPIMPAGQSSFKQYGQSVTFSLLGLEELLAAKVVTLLTRCAPRDLYDIYQTALLKQPLDSQLLRTLIRYYGLISRIPVLELFRLTLERVSDYDIQRLLHPLLVRGQFPSRSTMVEKTQKFITPFLSFSQEEVNAVDRFYTNGVLDAEALFRQEELRERIIQSPALKWRREQIRKTKTAKSNL